MRQPQEKGGCETIIRARSALAYQWTVHVQISVIQLLPLFQQTKNSVEYLD